MNHMIISPETHLRDTPVFRALQSANEILKESALAKGAKALFGHIAKIERPHIIEALDARMRSEAPHLIAIRERCATQIHGAKRNKPAVASQVSALPYREQNLLANWLYWSGSREAAQDETGWATGDLAAFFNGQAVQLRKRLDPVSTTCDCHQCGRGGATVKVSALSVASDAHAELKCAACGHLDYYGNWSGHKGVAPREVCPCDSCRTVRASVHAKAAEIANTAPDSLADWLCDPEPATKAIKTKEWWGTASEESIQHFLSAVGTGNSFAEAANAAFAGSHVLKGGFDGWPRLWMEQLVVAEVLEVRAIAPAPRDFVLENVEQRVAAYAQRRDRPNSVSLPHIWKALASVDHEQYRSGMKELVELQYATLSFGARYELMLKPEAQARASQLPPPAPPPLAHPVGILRQFTFEDMRGLAALREIVSKVQHSWLDRNLHRIASAAINAELPAHVAKLRGALGPALADKLDALAPRWLGTTRYEVMDKAIYDNDTKLTRAYMYWAHGSEVNGRGHLSMTVLNRQFRDVLDGGLAEHALHGKTQCPSCGSTAALVVGRLARSRELTSHNDSIAWLNCSLCGHRDATSTWGFDADPDSTRIIAPILVCSCAACAASRETLTAQSAKVAAGLHRALAQYVRRRSEQLLDGTTRASDTLPINKDWEATFVRLTREEEHQPINVVQRACNSVPRQGAAAFWQWRDGYQRLLDHLTEKGIITCRLGTDIDLSSDESILRCVFEQSFTDDGRCFKPEWPRYYAHIQREFDESTPGEWQRWLHAVRELGIVDHLFYYPLVFQYEDTPRRSRAEEQSATGSATVSVTESRADALPPELDSDEARAIALLTERGYVVFRKQVR